MTTTLGNFFLAVLAFVVSTSASGTPTFEQQYNQLRWFDLRDAIKRSEGNVRKLYLGAVASAFNDREGAERYLRRWQVKSND